MANTSCNCRECWWDHAEQTCKCIQSPPTTWKVEGCKPTGSLWAERGRNFISDKSAWAFAYMWAWETGEVVRVTPVHHKMGIALRETMRVLHPS